MKTLTILFAIICFSATTVKSYGQANYMDTHTMFAAPDMKTSVKMNPMSIATGVIKVKMQNQPSGNYRIELINAEGKVVSSPILVHQENTPSETVNFERELAGGMYQIVITRPDNMSTTQKVLLLM